MNAYLKKMDQSLFTTKSYALGNKMFTDFQ